MASFNPKSPRKKPSAPTSEAPFFQAARGNTPFFPIQPKLTIGKAGDKFEREADAMAQSVVKGEAGNQAVQRMGGPEEEELAQGKLQRMEEEELMTKLQRQEEEEEAQPKLQKMEAEEEEMMA